MGAYIMKNYYDVKIGRLTRRLKLVDNGGIRYFSFNMLGDEELNFEVAKALSKLIDKSIEAIVTVESKSIALAQEMAHLLDFKRYVVIRKTKKSYMFNEMCFSGNTIISGKCDYFIDGEDIEFLKGKKILFLDDVISTCGTLRSISALLEKCSLNIHQIACAFCEGRVTSSFKGIPVISCGLFPLPEDANND